MSWALSVPASCSPGCDPLLTLRSPLLAAGHVTDEIARLAPPNTNFTATAYSVVGSAITPAFYDTITTLYPEAIGANYSTNTGTYQGKRPGRHLLYPAAVLTSPSLCARSAQTSCTGSGAFKTTPPLAARRPCLPAPPPRASRPCTSLCSTRRELPSHSCFEPTFARSSEGAC